MWAVTALLVSCFAIGGYCRTDHLPPHLVRPAEVLHAACQKETGALEDDIRNSHSAHIVDTPEVRCYIYCLFRSSSTMDENGVVSFELLDHLLTDVLSAKWNHLAKTCIKELEENRCDYAYKVLRCFFDLDHEIAHLI